MRNRIAERKSRVRVRAKVQDHLLRENRSHEERKRDASRPNQAVRTRRRTTSVLTPRAVQQMENRDLTSPNQRETRKLRQQLSVHSPPYSDHQELR